MVPLRCRLENVTGFINDLKKRKSPPSGGGRGLRKQPSSDAMTAAGPSQRMISMTRMHLDLHSLTHDRRLQKETVQ